MLLAGLACGTPDAGPPGDTAPPPGGETGETADQTPFLVDVQVTVDGTPVEGATVVQAGREAAWTTDVEGRVAVEVDPTVPGDLVLVAAWPDARNVGAPVDGAGALTLALERFDPADNEAYVFADPGAHAVGDSTAAECGHCHLTLHEGWAESAHRSAAKNPVVHEVYQGVDFDRDEEGCADVGAWEGAREPGTGAAVQACVVAEPAPADGGCADCHAPGIGGVLAGHDLLDAIGLAYEYGVHCDVCHKVESVDPGAAPGVAGWLRVLRPSDLSPSPLLGPWHPLQFGPYIDVVNPAMGAVYRAHLHEADFCGGCHQLEPVVAGADPARWPDGRLPVHTTWAEWEAGPMNPAAPCQSCHMPPVADVGNAADLGNEFDLVPGVAGGWYRAPGAVRAHTWDGPRAVASGMLELAARLELATEVDGDVLVVRATVQNVGPGHALPTGEPLRQVVLEVDAACAGEPLDAVGGDVIPDWGGAAAERRAPDTLDRFPGAAVGDLVRLARAMGWVDYEGYGPFGDGRFDAEAKGVPDYEFVGSAQIVAVTADGVVTVDHPEWLAQADVAWWVRAADTTAALAGRPGFGFARVLADAGGRRMVPHALATDVVSDNRLLPGASWTSEHRFRTVCADPVAAATLSYRAWPWAEAQRYGWELTPRTMAEASR